MDFNILESKFKPHAKAKIECTVQNLSRKLYCRRNTTPTIATGLRNLKMEIIFWILYYFNIMFFLISHLNINKITRAFSVFENNNNYYNKSEYDNSDSVWYHFTNGVEGREYFMWHHTLHIIRTAYSHKDSNIIVHCWKSIISSWFKNFTCLFLD